ncbi:MAG: Fic family protein, partial [Desulfovibrio sp.]|nr:Fic family protein [Desulfovibrio sp.]
MLRIEAVKAVFESLPVTPHVLRSLRESARLLSVHYSTAIEGNRLTRQEVDDFFRKAVKPRTRDEREIRAYSVALDYIETLMQKTVPLTVEHLQKIHTLVEGGKPGGGAGTPWRDGQNAVYDSVSGAIIYMPPEAKDVPNLMSDLVDWLHSAVSELPVPLVAGLLHYQFVTIHPFYDGNGRTARLAATLVMRRYRYGMKGVYALEEYYARDLAAYYAAVAAHPHHNYYFGRADADLTNWLDYFCTGVAEAFEKVKKVADAERKRGGRDKSNQLRELDSRQRLALTLFARQQNTTAAELGEVLGLSARNAAVLCRKWVNAGFLSVADPSKRAR